MVELKPHQRKAVEELSNGKILCGGVGTGKSLTSLMFFYEKIASGQTEKDLYVITTAKKRDDKDWEGEVVKAAQEGVGAVYVDSWNNISKYKEVTDAFFIFDEQRLVGSGAWTKAFLKIAQNNKWILLSATPGDTWLDYIPVFIANGFYKNRTEFKREHVVYNTFTKYPKVDRYIGVKRLVENRRKVLVTMPYEKHTKRILHTVLVDFDEEAYFMASKKRWNVFEDRPIKDAGELLRVMRKIANTDESRIRIVREVLRKHPKLIIFYNFDYELDILREGLREWHTNATIEITDLLIQKPASGTKTDAIFVDSIGEDVSTNFDRSSRPSSPTKSRSVSSATASRPSLSESSEWSGTAFESGWATSEKESRLQSEMKLRIAQSEFLMKQKRLGNVPSESTSGNTSWTDSGRPYDSSAASVGRTRLLERSSNTDSDPSPMMTGSGSKSLSETVLSPNSSTATSAERTSSTDMSVSPLSHPDGTNGEGISGVPNSSASVSIAEWNGHKHEAIPASDSWVYLVQYTAGSEGWNCVDTDAILFFSLTYSYKAFEQSQGRIDRLNTLFTDLHYYILRSKASIDNGIWRSLKNKEDFNEGKFVGKW